MSEVQGGEVCDTEGSSIHGGGMQEVRVPVCGESDGDRVPSVGVANAPLALSKEERQLAAQERTAAALESISNFLSGTTLPQLVQTLTINTMAREITSALVQHDGRKALDPSLAKQNSLETAYLVEGVLNKLSSHLKGRSKPVLDGEELMGVKGKESE